MTYNHRGNRVYWFGLTGYCFNFGWSGKSNSEEQLVVRDNRPKVTKSNRTNGQVQNTSAPKLTLDYWTADSIDAGSPPDVVGAPHAVGRWSAFWFASGAVLVRRSRRARTVCTVHLPEFELRIPIVMFIVHMDILGPMRIRWDSDEILNSNFQFENVYFEFLTWLPLIFTFSFQ